MVRDSAAGYLVCLYDVLPILAGIAMLVFSVRALYVVCKLEFTGDPGWYILLLLLLWG